MRFLFFFKMILLEVTDFLRQFMWHILAVVAVLIMWYLFLLTPLMEKIQQSEIIQSNLTKNESDIDRFKTASPNSFFSQSDSLSVSDTENEIYQWIKQHQSVRLISLVNFDGPVGRLTEAGFWSKNAGQDPNNPNSMLVPPGSPVMNTTQLLSFAVDNTMQWQRHEISLVLEGNYFQIMEFLNQFQSTSIFWKSLEFTVIEYSLARVNVTLYIYEKI